MFQEYHSAPKKLMMASNQNTLSVSLWMISPAKPTMRKSTPPKMEPGIAFLSVSINPGSVFIAFLRYHLVYNSQSRPTTIANVHSTPELHWLISPRKMVIIPSPRNRNAPRVPVIRANGFLISNPAMRKSAPKVTNTAVWLIILPRLYIACRAPGGAGPPVHKS